MLTNKTGQIINTLPTDYSTSEVNKQKDIGGEFFGDYFYDLNNGKVTDKELEKISYLSNSKYYIGAWKKYKYKIKEKD